MGRFIDYTGTKIGRLTFINEYKRKGRRVWVCKCDCGGTSEYRSNYICQMKSLGKVFECASCKKDRRYPSLSGNRYGRLTVLHKLNVSDRHHTWYLCRCDCGTVRDFRGTSLKSTKSCGCYMRKVNSKWVNTTQYPPEHGYKSALNRRTIKRKIYNSRNAFVSKCYNEKNPCYKTHGKRGVTVCELWRNSPIEFFKWSLKNGYEEGFGFFLKKGSKQFNPSTTYWQDKADFCTLNNSKWIEYKGEVKSITQWANVLGCSMTTLSNRIIKYGVERAFDLKWIPEKKQFYGTEHFEKDIVRLYQEGFTYMEIMKKIGCASSTIKRFLTKNNVPIRKAVRRK